MVRLIQQEILLLMAMLVSDTDNPYNSKLQVFGKQRRYVLEKI